MTAYEYRYSDWSSDVCSSDLRTTSHAQVLSDATAGVYCTAAPTKAAASAKLKAFIAFSLVIEIYAHITMRGKGKPKTPICCCIVCRGPIGYGHPHIRNRARHAARHLTVACMF